MGKRRVAYSIVIRQHLIDDKNYLGLLPCLGHNHPLVIKQYKKWAASTSSFVVRDKAQWRSGLFPLEVQQQLHRLRNFFSNVHLFFLSPLLLGLTLGTYTSIDVNMINMSCFGRGWMDTLVWNDI